MYGFLDKINDTEDLKKLNIKDLSILSEDIRKFLVDTTSKTGGHLAPNLGVVELTVALHYVFNSPRDKIIFDVGHQSYVHKILTGRKNRFETLRQLNGISGFPRTNESIHDVFNTGHSSTSISSAIGIATANKLNGNDDYTIAVIGDGSLTGGLAFEGLNNARTRDTNLIVILNDNQMSISQSVGNLSVYLNKMRSNAFYTSAKKKIRTFFEYIPFLGNLIIKFVAWIKNGFKQIILPKSTLFEQFGFKYLGPIDGHDINDLVTILKRAKTVDKPVLVHVITKKGKGYLPAENFPDKFHGVGPFNKETGKILSSHKETYSNCFGEHLIDLAIKNKKIVAITAAMPDGTGLSKFKKFFPKRFFDVGIAESHAVTFASGLAKQGFIPVFAVYSTFLQRAYDEIMHDIALQNAHVIFAIDRAGITGQDGETHHGIYDLSFLSTIPNIVILSPKDGMELQSMLDFAINYDGPVAIRYPKGNFVNSLSDNSTDITKAEIIKSGKDISIIAIGKMVSRAIEISKILEENNIDAEIINARVIKPLDKETILNSILKTKTVVTIEDNIISGGLASKIQEIIINTNDIHSIFFAYPNDFIRHGSIEEIEKLYNMDAESIANKIISQFRD